VRLGLIVVLLGIVVGVGVDILRTGGIQAWLAKMGPGSAAGPPYEARGQVFEVDGHGLYLDCRGSGSPTVILEAGFGAGADSWGRLFDDIAGVTRVCAWDRPGIGRSEGRGLHSAGETARTLQALLDARNERGPYVVVAHSFGGVYARLFAAQPESDGRVGALVQIDTYEPDLGMPDDPALPADVRAEIQQSLDSTARMLAGGESLDWDASMAELSAARPTTVDVVHLTQDPKGKYLDRDADLRAALLASEARNVALIYPNGITEPVPGAGHFIHLDRPDLVLERVRALITRLRD
jgi:pimeloyl-ACP methyl ester carboxylesterase